MEKVNHRNSTSRILSIGLALLLAFSTSLFAQDGDVDNGKALFKANCAACHKLDKASTGPYLRNIEQRLADEQGLDREWLYKWIKNSAGMIKSGDAYAVAVWEANDKKAMTAFPQLSNKQIDDILAYTAADPVVKPPEEGPKDDGGEGTGISNQIILGALALLFALLALGLYLVNNTLRKFAIANGTVTPEQLASQRTPLWKAFLQNQFLMIVTTIVLLLGSAYFAYGYLMQIGVDQGYQPVQPIHFSHKIHAGDNKIDCKYCHSSARVSKTSGIPSLNVCMNCHKNISDYNGETTLEYSQDFYNGEIQKLYDAVGWDAASQKYTGETKPVKWVRIHNLPDFAYFNHSQHVTVAGVQCQTCHGPVEEMEIVEQFAPLTMGWCIDCHRKTNVNLKGSEYYEKIHAELKKKYGVEQFTAAQMGALECGKCHY